MSKKIDKLVGVPKFPKGLLGALNEFFKNRPMKAEQDLKRAVREAEKGTSVLVNSVVSREFERDLRKLAKKRGVDLKFCGSRFTYKVTTQADREREKQELLRTQQAHEDYINSPG